MEVELVLQFLSPSTSKTVIESKAQSLGNAGVVVISDDDDDEEEKEGEKPKKLVVQLDHQYTPAELSFSALKGKDDVIVSALVRATTSAHCDIFPCTDGDRRNRNELRRWLCG